MNSKERGEQEDIVIAELKGLRRFIRGESFGGNAGPNRAAANAIYKDGEIIFTNYPAEYQKKNSDVTFLIITPPADIEQQLFDEGKVSPPELIENIVFKSSSGIPVLKDGALCHFSRNDDALNDYFRQRALQHNAFMVLQYMEQGGDVSFLPNTSFMPNTDQLKAKIIQGS